MFFLVFSRVKIDFFLNLLRPPLIELSLLVVVLIAELDGLLSFRGFASLESKSKLDREVPVSIEFRGLTFLEDLNGSTVRNSEPLLFSGFAVEALVFC